MPELPDVDVILFSVIVVLTSNGNERYVPSTYTDVPGQRVAPSSVQK